MERGSVLEWRAVVAAFRRYGCVDRVRTVAGERKKRDGAGRRERETTRHAGRRRQLEQTIVIINSEVSGVGLAR